MSIPSNPVSKYKDHGNISLVQGRNAVFDDKSRDMVEVINKAKEDANEVILDQLYKTIKECMSTSLHTSREGYDIHVTFDVLEFTHKLEELHNV
mgnify:CR=1 FL=1